MLPVPDPHANRRAAFLSLKERLAAAQRPAPPQERRLPCELPALDLALGGGLPAGLVTLEGASSSGRGAIAFRALAVASRSAFVALLDDGACYPPALVEAGVLLERLLIVPVREGRLLARALDTLLRSRVCRVVVVRARAWSAAIWGRFSQLARETGSTLLAFLDDDLHAPAGLPALRLRCRKERFVLCGRGSVGSAFLGYTFCVEPLARTLPARSPLSLRAEYASEGMALRERALRSARAPQRAAQARAL